jgi:hypothetical protein
VNKQKVYRSGSMTPSPDAGGVNASYATTVEADLLNPRAVGRLGSLFAAPSLGGVVRWVLGNDMCRYETRVREITVDADTTYVYSVDAWESLSWNMRGTVEDKARAYWDTGMTLTEWLARAEAEDFDASQWEVLIDPADVLAVRNVSANRLLMVAPQDEMTTLKRVTKTWKYAA